MKTASVNNGNSWKGKKKVVFKLFFFLFYCLSYKQLLLLFGGSAFHSKVFCHGECSLFVSICNSAQTQSLILANLFVLFWGFFPFR